MQCWRSHGAARSVLVERSEPSELLFTPDSRAESIPDGVFAGCSVYFSPKMRVSLNCFRLRSVT
ncbi:hypothetical protein XAP412_320049 [Xanthomonas phaseoli pv. phaseoli]|uniref:Uncharacterized protein n=1 Tax=Xanthomonas campestris pv. phaseoli TaxID=317013 RepID=A0AB38DZX4_XANCH|nr:hypothetical protein XAP6984_380046 [Xanthomonas phaseoli pv. phaseoli]SON83800.1 hypothetical protein XAP412_320049 [Xanthomonas phaseoli pv. phaseoli]SON88247.1 hypothetical protein XAP7430_360049 [Xanthomonas phaseoli pv. phaseoli]